MIDPGTERPVRVLVAEEIGPYIRLTEKAVDQVQQLLKEHGVSFWVGHHWFSVDHKPGVGYIKIHHKTDPACVQSRLDGIP